MNLNLGNNNVQQPPINNTQNTGFNFNQGSQFQPQPPQ